MYTDVLVPVAGTAGLEPVIRRAADLAATDGTLHLLHVVDTAALPAETGEIYAELEPVGEEALDEAILVAGNTAVGGVQSSIARGSPPDAILSYVEANDIDLVVMATHGRTGLDRLLLGSVTEKVVRASPVPVLTVSLTDEQLANEG